jgi:hypothetical protein
VLRRQKVCSPSGCLSAWPALLAANSLVHAAARTRARPPPPPPPTPPPTPTTAALGKRHAVTKALDRLTVQVFHLEVCDWVWWWRWWRCCVCVWRFAGIMDSARPQLAQSAAG